MYWYGNFVLNSLPFQELLQVSSITSMLIADIRSLWVSFDKKFTNGTFRKVALKSTTCEFCDNIEIFSHPVDGLCPRYHFKET